MYNFFSFPTRNSNIGFVIVIESIFIHDKLCIYVLLKTRQACGSCDGIHAEIRTKCSLNTEDPNLTNKKTMILPKDTLHFQEANVAKLGKMINFMYFYNDRNTSFIITMICHWHRWRHFCVGTVGRNSCTGEPGNHNALHVSMPGHQSTANWFLGQNINHRTSQTS